MSGVATDITVFNKGGVVTTDANGLADVIFTTAQPNIVDYVVMLTVLDTGIGYGAYVTNVSQTGFTINSWVIGGAGVPAPATVQCIVRSKFND